MKKVVLLAAMLCLVSECWASPVYEVDVNEACPPEIEYEYDQEQETEGEIAARVEAARAEATRAETARVEATRARRVAAIRAAVVRAEETEEGRARAAAAAAAVAAEAVREETPAAIRAAAIRVVPDLDTIPETAEAARMRLQVLEEEEFDLIVGADIVEQTLELGNIREEAPLYRDDMIRGAQDGAGREIRLVTQFPTAEVITDMETRIQVLRGRFTALLTTLLARLVLQEIPEDGFIDNLGIPFTYSGM
jgi:hypothetical protein